MKYLALIKYFLFSVIVPVLLFNNRFNKQDGQENPWRRYNKSPTKSMTLPKSGEEHDGQEEVLSFIGNSYIW